MNAKVPYFKTKLWCVGVASFCMTFSASAAALDCVPKWVIVLSGCIGASAVAIRAFLSNPGSDPQISVSQDTLLLENQTPPIK